MSTQSELSSMKYRLFTSLWLIVFTLLLLLSGCRPFDSGGDSNNGGDTDTLQTTNPHDNVTIPPANQSPSASFSVTPASGEAPLDVSFDASGSTDDDGSIASYAWDFGDGGSASGETVSHTYTTAGTFTITLTVTDDDGDSDTASQSINIAASGSLPPDPASIAPPLDKTRPLTVYDSTAFLYTGSNPVQTGVAEDTIAQHRAAVLRGKVMDRDGQPLPGVTVTILDHPELGQTLTRADGLFDLVVNGGGHLTVNYHKPGYLVAQRRIKAPWNEYAWLPDVVLVAQSPESNTLDLASNEPVQVLQGPLVSDDRGERRTTLLVPQGVNAQMVMADGSSRAFSSDTLTVRATEFTVGDKGPEAMPGELPPGVGYTYAVELSIDEAEAAGAASVKFDKPLYQYVENFIGFPVGDEAPLYYYNRQSGNWEQEEPGIVIKILDIVSGMANIDTDGDNQPEDNDTLNSLGFTDEERTTLASLYPPDTSLWRTRITHFSPFDTNWFNRPNNEINEAINNIEIIEDEPETNSCNSRGSIIDCQNQTLGERIPIAGTPFSLNYRSLRMPGYHVGQGIVIRPLNNISPMFIQGIRISISTAGQRTEVYFDSSRIISTPELSYRYIWDGLDAYGRPVTGEVPTIIQFGYEYSVAYLICRSAGNMYCPPSPPREIQTRFAQRTVVLNKSAPPYQNEGGWSLSPHHRYSKKSATLHEGNGNSRSALPIGVLAAGNYAYLPGSDNTRCADGDSALSGCHLPTWGIAILTDGSLIVTDDGYGGEGLEGVSVRKVGPDGIVSTLISSVDPWNAQEGDLVFFPTSIATGPDDSIYVGDCDGGHRVLKIASNGEVSVYAGTEGSGDSSGDGGPATAAQIGCPSALTTGPDGSLYIADGFRIRKVNPQGIISTIAGGGTLDNNEDGVRASDIDNVSPRVMAVAEDGTIYLGMYNRIRKIDPTGIIWTVAGNDSNSISGDGGPAIEAGLGEIQGLAVADDGSLYVSAYAWINDNQTPSVIRKISPNGIINKLPGTDTLEIVDQTNGYSYPIVHNMIVGPNSSLYAAVQSTYGGAGGVYRFNSTGYRNNETLIASRSGDEIYRFEQGRHTETLSSYTGAALYRFAYNAEGLLIGITDADDKETVIERDTEGRLTAIVAPGGQRTVLSVNSDGYLESISNPAEDTITLRYRNGGLLASMSDAEGNITSFGYDGDGRLVRDTDAAGGEQILSRTRTPTGYHVTRTTASGAQTTYMVDQLPTGGSQFINVFANGSRSQVSFNPNGSQNIVTADGTTSVMSFGSDPRFGMQSPILSSQLLSTPGGLQTNISQRRNVQLEDKADPLSLISLSNTTSINGQDFLKLFDVTTRKWTATSPAGRSVSEIINDSGRPIRSQIAGLDATVFTYDSEGRLISSVRGSGVSRQHIDLEYNQAGLLSRIEDSSGNVARFDYDVADHLIRHTLPAEREIGYTYNRNGRITSLTSPSGAVHGFSYTPVGLLASYVAPDAGDDSSITAYQYDTDKRLTRIDRPDGNSIVITYNDSNQISLITDGNKDISYHYNAETGQNDLIDTGDVSEAMTYDGALPVTFTWRGAIEASVEIGYDENLRVSNRAVNTEAPVSFIYDADGMLVGAGALSLTRDLQTGFVTTTVLDQVEDSSSYDSMGRLTEYQAIYQTSGGSATTLLSLSYAYDSTGRISQISETIDGSSTVYDYSYDAAGNLAQVSIADTPIASYSYDVNGNRIQSGSEEASYDAQDRLLSRGATTYAYTAAGFLASATNGGQTTRYDYTPLGDLNRVVQASGNTDYIYDGLGRRVREIHNGNTGRGFVWADDRLLGPVAEVNSANEVVNRFIYASRDHVPDYMVKNGARYRIITDQVGSVRLVVNASDGSIAQRIDYDSWGIVTRDTNPGFQPFGFAGGLYDANTGLVRSGARDYDATSGRWTAKDPLGMAGDNINLYVYAANNPLGDHDPKGTQSPQSPGNMCGGNSGGMCIEPPWMCAQRCAEESLQRRTPTRRMQSRPLGCWRDSDWSMCMSGCGLMRRAPSWAEEHPVLNYLERLLYRLAPNPYNNANFTPGNPQGNVPVGLRG